MPWIVWCLITIVAVGLTAGFTVWACEREMEERAKEWAKERTALYREINKWRSAHAERDT